MMEALTMAHYSIRELIQEWSKGNTETFLLGDYYKIPNESDTDTRPEFIRAYVDLDVASSHKLDNRIKRKYADYITVEDYESITEALEGFIDDNYVYILTHNAELTRMFDALNSEFNPIENYDRYEDTSTSNSESESANTSTSESANTSTSTSEGGSQSTSATNSLTDNVYGWDTNTANPTASTNGGTGASASDTRNIAESSTRGLASSKSDGRTLNALNTITSHIHGNIGVTKATELIADVLSLYSSSGWYDVLIEKMIREQCMIIDYGNNII